MFKVFMTEALIANVGAYVVRNVLPIAPLSDEERGQLSRDERRPYRPDNNMRAPRGFKTAGVAFPLKEFKQLTVLSEVGIPLFDGHGAVWLIDTGIAIVFNDIEVYYVISEIRLHNWLLSEIHNALFVEYNKLVAANAELMKHMSGVAESPLPPDVQTIEVFADETEYFPYGDRHLYFAADQHCRGFPVPIYGASLHYSAKRKICALLEKIPKESFKREPLFSNAVGEGAIVDGSYNAVGHRALYARLQSEGATFVHLFDRCDIVTEACDDNVDEITDILLMNDKMHLYLVLRFIDAPTQWVRAVITPDIASQWWQIAKNKFVVGNMSQEDVYEQHAWIMTHFLT